MTLPETITSARTGAAHRADHEALHARYNAPAILMDSTHLSSAQLLNLHTTAVELLPAPGGRFYYAIHSFILHYRFVTTPYFGLSYGDDLVVGFGSTLAAILDEGEGAAFRPLKNSASLLSYEEDWYALPPTTTSGQAAIDYAASRPASLIEDKAIGIGLANPITDGDGTLSVRTFYSLIDGA